MTAEEYYQQGNAWRKQGDFKRLLQSIITDMWTTAVLVYSKRKDN